MIAAVILSGGQSSRMGTDKSQLKIDGHTLIEHMYKLLGHCDIQIIGISGENHIQDSYKNKGPLAGILASLAHYLNHQYILFVPIDMPLLNTEILLNLIQQKPLSINHYEDYNLPLFMKNSREMRTTIENQLRDEKLSIYELLQLTNAKGIKNKYSNQYFINTNTPEQWQKATLLLRE